jgi:N6-adenosine-specific RNA methylase IME4
LAAKSQPQFRLYDVNLEGNARDFVVQQALLRRHLEKPQRAMIAARLVTSRIGFNQTDTGTTIVGAAKLANVTVKMVERALKIHRNFPNIADAVANGRIPTIRVAQKLSELPLSVQHSVLAKASNGSELKKDIHAAARDWRLAQPVVCPVGGFRAIVADPPWPMDKTPYPTMTVDQIEQDLGALLKEKAADDCFLFLCTTQGNLFEAMKMVAELGWRYRLTMIWRKTNGPKNPAGPMYSEEFVVVASKGSPQFTDTREFKTGFAGKKGRHSEKPQEFFDLVSRVTMGPRLELYARKRHDGFEPHGNEVEVVGSYMGNQSERQSILDLPHRSGRGQATLTLCEPKAQVASAFS